MKSSRLSRLAQALLPSLIFFSKAGCFCACKATQILSWSNLPRQIRKCPVFQAFSLQAHSCTGECNKTGKLNSSEKRFENSFQILFPPLFFELCAKLNQHSMEFGAEIICLNTRGTGHSDSEWEFLTVLTMLNFDTKPNLRNVVE